MELKRIFSKKNIFILMIGIVINAALFIYYATDSGHVEDTVLYNKEYNIILKDFMNKPFDDGINYIKENKLASKNPIYKDIRQNLVSLKGFSQNINTVVERADCMLDNPLFSDTNSFSNKSIAATKDKYEKLSGIEVELGNYNAVKKIYEYKFAMIICFFMLILILIGLYDERESEFWKLTYSTSSGRFRLAIRRSGVLLCFSFIYFLILNLEQIAISYLIFGDINVWMNPVQSVTGLELFAREYNVLQFLLYIIGVQWLTIIAVIGVIYLLFTVILGRKNILIFLGIFSIVEYILYVNILPQGKFSVFRNINIINIQNINELITTYKNVMIFGKIYEYSFVIVLVFAFMALICYVIAPILYIKQRPTTKGIFIGEYLLHGVPAFFKELYKTVFLTKSHWLMIFVIVVSGYITVLNCVTIGEKQKYIEELYINYGGSDYSEIEQLVNELKHNDMVATEKKLQAEMQYKNGEISAQELAVYTNNSNYHSMQYARYNEIASKISYVNELKENNRDAWLISDFGYDRIIGANGKIFEYIIVAISGIMFFLIGMSSYNNEIKSRMLSIVLPTVTGKKIFILKKIMSLVLLFLVYGIVINCVFYFILFKHYGCCYLDAPIQSLYYFSNVKLDITIKEAILIRTGCKLVLLEGFGLIGFFCGLFKGGTK